MKQFEKHFQAMCDRTRKEGRRSMRFCVDGANDNPFSTKFFRVLLNKETNLYRVFVDRAEWEDHFDVGLTNAPMDNPLVYTENEKQ